MAKLKPGRILIGVTEIDTTKPKVVPGVPKGGKLPAPNDVSGKVSSQPLKPNSAGE
jgi:hypothetical protein